MIFTSGTGERNSRVHTGDRQEVISPSQPLIRLLQSGLNRSPAAAGMTMSKPYSCANARFSGVQKRSASF